MAGRPLFITGIDPDQISDILELWDRIGLDLSYPLWWNYGPVIMYVGQIK